MSEPAVVSDRPALSLIGFGAFARFAAPHLRPHFDVSGCDAQDVTGVAAALGVRSTTVQGAAEADFVVLCVPAQHLDGVLHAVAPRVRSGTLVLDVCSVKARPVESMLRLLPPSVRVVGTHPLFGPQSGRDGIAGLPVALCPARADSATVACVRGFLAGTLGLRVIETTPEEHDRQMAYVQGLTHLVSRALGAMELPDTPMATRAYRRLLEMKADVEQDSLDLFLTIERSNPFADAVRAEFLRRLAEIEKLITG